MRHVTGVNSILLLVGTLMSGIRRTPTRLPRPMRLRNRVRVVTGELMSSKWLVAPLSPRTMKQVVMAGVPGGSLRDYGRVTRNLLVPKLRVPVK